MNSRILTFLILMTACESIPDESDFIPDSLDRPNQEGWNSEVIVTRDGVMEMKLKYSHMMRWDNKQLTTFSGGMMIDMFENGSHSAILTADSGLMRNASNELSAFGNVVVISDSGVSLRSQILFWDEPAKKIRASGFVQISTDEDTLNGFDFESDRNLNNWKIRRAFGQSAKDVDIRTGTVRSGKSDVNDDHSRQLDEGVKELLKEEDVH